MPDIEIKRGYEVLPDNNVRFGIRVTNNSNSAISDVEVILDYNESLFNLEGGKIQNLGTIPPTVPRTAKFILKPLGCIHKEEISATVRYKDHQWKKHTEEMRSKEVHCVCPFLKEKSITRAEFLRLSNSGYLEERGVNFEGITVDKLVEFISHTCKNRLYKVDEFPIENGKIIYLAGDALGEKAYYLLTAIVKEYEGLTQILLRASSDKNYGLNGFLNEILDNLRHLVVSASAREIGVIKKEHVINIIDSVVQRSSFSVSDGTPSVNVQDSVVQRAEIKADEERKKREGEERKAKEERERQRKLEAENKEKELQKQRAEEERLKRRNEEITRLQREKENGRIGLEKEAKSSGGKWFVGLIIILAVLALGWNGTQDSSSSVTPQKTTPSVTATPVMTAKATPSAAAVVPPSADQKTITNSIGMEFVQIPSGEFDMGNKAGRFDDEGPVHHVKISNVFYMGKYEVTKKQWQDVMGNNLLSFKSGNLPVEMVSWNDAQDFIKKLNEKEGGNKYQLPSEAEWEYSARAGTTTRYSFGDDESMLGDYAWYYANSEGKTHDVGQKKPNPWGLYDMYGNVEEWVQDNWHGDYNGAPTDGSAWESGSNRVARGGSWYCYAGDCQPEDRYGGTPDNRDGFIGFRLLRDV
ncbi:MAG: SUMF1/EgtB/PvdO family nonheme iron enzyme [Candidatus Methanoperedens sp.]